MLRPNTMRPQYQTTKCQVVASHSDRSLGICVGARLLVEALAHN